MMRARTYVNKYLFYYLAAKCSFTVLGLLVYTYIIITMIAENQGVGLYNNIPSLEHEWIRAKTQLTTPDWFICDLNYNGIAAALLSKSPISKFTVNPECMSRLQ